MAGWREGLKSVAGGESPAAAAAPKRIVDVGWLIKADKSSFLWETPRTATRNDAKPQHAKAVSYCPAVLDHEARLFEVPCPFDLHLRFAMDDKGNPGMINVAGDQAPMRQQVMNQTVGMQPRKEWRHPDRPIIQIMTPYVFLADESVYMTQLPPILHWRDPPLPGTILGGRFPIDVWPRPPSWAFEWYDPKKDLILKRGEPWFYLRFETTDPSRPVRLVEATLTPELDAYINGMDGVVGYVNRTFSLFETARQRRPETLLVKKEK